MWKAGEGQLEDGQAGVPESSRKVGCRDPPPVFGCGDLLVHGFLFVFFGHMQNSRKYWRYFFCVFFDSCISCCCMFLVVFEVI